MPDLAPVVLHGRALGDQARRDRFVGAWVGIEALPDQVALLVVVRAREFRQVGDAVHVVPVIPVRLHPVACSGKARGRGGSGPHVCRGLEAEPVSHLCGRPLSQRHAEHGTGRPPVPVISHKEHQRVPGLGVPDRSRFGPQEEVREGEFGDRRRSPACTLHDERAILHAKQPQCAHTPSSISAAVRRSEPAQSRRTARPEGYVSAPGLSSRPEPVPCLDHDGSTPQLTSPARLGRFGALMEGPEANPGPHPEGSVIRYRGTDKDQTR